MYISLQFRNQLTPVIPLLIPLSLAPKLLCPKVIPLGNIHCHSNVLLPISKALIVFPNFTAKFCNSSGLPFACNHTGAQKARPNLLQLPLKSPFHLHPSYHLLLLKPQPCCKTMVMKPHCTCLIATPWPQPLNNLQHQIFHQ